MKRIGLILILISTISLSAYADGGWRKNEMEVTVFYSSASELLKIHELKLNGDIYNEGYGIFYLIPEEIKLLEQLEIEYKITIPDLNQHYKDFWDKRDEYHSYQEIVDLADSLEEHFPFICEKHLFGTSMEGRELGALKISDNVTTDENEAEVFFDAGIHGDETIGPEIAIRFAKMLCLSYNNDTYITDLINDREIWIYYMVNPDGRVNMSRYNHNGVDLNRDCGYMWDQWGNSPGAYSQTESCSLRECALGNQFAIHVTYHSGTESIGYPWSYRPQQTYDHNHIHFLAGLYSSASGYPSLEYGQGYSGIYPINGSTKDANYGIMGSVSWTMEISYIKQPPTDEIMLYYNYNEPSMLEMIEYAGYGIEGMITDSETGDPVAAMISVDQGFPCYSDPLEGDYHKFLIPGTYSIKVMANGYQTSVVDNVVINENESTTVNVQLQPQEGHYAYRIISCRIPGNNHADEGNTSALLDSPDQVNYSIGRSGWAVIDMQYPVVNGPGDDLTIYEGDDSPESYTLYIGFTMDGPWLELGTGTGTTSFDIYPVATPGSKYLKIMDDGDGPGQADNAGFDLDAIKIAPLPGTPINPTPQNGQNNVDPFTSLAWEAGQGGTPTWYRIYLGTDTPPANIIDGDSITDNFYSPPPLNFDTTYYWRIDAGNYGGMTTGNVWSFNTIPPPDEGFETGDFSLHNWQMSGDNDWTTDDETQFWGNYSARSGSINDNQSSSLIITLEVEDLFTSSISFRKKVSSAIGDKLQFIIDGEIIDEWTGISMFSEESYPVGDGIHTFEWRYIKNENASAGEDCAWIDYIYFPTLADPSAFAGNDTSVCSGASIQLNGQATNYNMVEWITSGTGTFDDPYCLNPVYSPSTEDINLGELILTMNVTAGEELLSDDLILTVIPFPDKPSMPEGPDQVDLFYNDSSEYSTTETANTGVYFWSIEPAMAGTISGNGITSYVIWNTNFEGNAFVSVTGINECGEGEPSEIKETEVYNTVGMVDPLISGFITIMPNPNNGCFGIHFQDKSIRKADIRIFNSYGQMIWQSSGQMIPENRIIMIRIKNQPQGVYFLSVKTTTTHEVISIILK